MIYFIYAILALVPAAITYYFWGKDVDMYKTEYTKLSLALLSAEHELNRMRYVMKNIAKGNATVELNEDKQSIHIIFKKETQNEEAKSGETQGNQGA